MSRPPFRGDRSAQKTSLLNEWIGLLRDGLPQGQAHRQCKNIVWGWIALLGIQQVDPHKGQEGEDRRLIGD